MKCLVVLLIAGSVTSLHGSKFKPFSASSAVCENVLDAATVRDIRSYQPDVDKILDFVLNQEKGETWRQLAEFVDCHGPRLAGTPYLEQAITDRFMYFSQLKGTTNVHTESVVVPNWIRGEAEVVLLDAWAGGRNKTLQALSLGYSVGTETREGFVGEAIVVRSFDELHRKDIKDVEGKIVVFNQDFEGYDISADYRLKGASEAAAKKGIAALIRSVTGHSLYTPHTGMMSYDEKLPKVPAISITVEDAELMWRKQQRGEKLRLFIRSTSTREKDTISRNTVAELEGSGNADEIVIVSGHIDSWDVGQGAMDDGGGAAISWRVLDILSKLNLRTRRTIRAVLFTAEEFGLIGGKTYFQMHKEFARDMQFIMESDFGTFTPRGIASGVKNEKAQCMIRQCLQLLAKINATELQLRADGPDIGDWFQIGVPGGSLYNHNEDYFNFHHSDADMVQLMNPDDLDKATAVWTALAYVFAQIKDRIPHDVP